MEMIIGKFLGTILILTVHNPNVHHNPKTPTDVTGFPDKNTLKLTQLTQPPAFRHRNLSAAEWLTDFKQWNDSYTDTLPTRMTKGSHTAVSGEDTADITACSPISGKPEIPGGSE